MHISSGKRNLVICSYPEVIYLANLECRNEMRSGKNNQDKNAMLRAPHKFPAHWLSASKR